MRSGVEQLIIAVNELADEFDADELRQLFIASDRLEAIKCRAVARLDASGAAAADGAINTAQWLRTRAGCSSREASALVKRGRLLNKCPALGTAWADGHLSRGQVECVVAKVTSSREAAFVEQAPELLAALQGLSARDTETALSHWAGKVDAVVDAPPQDRSERSLFLSSGYDGWGELSGRLDPEAYRVVSAALAAAIIVESVDEPARTPAQRRHDALAAVARQHLDHGVPSATTRGSRPDVHVVVTLEDLEAGTGRDLDGAVLDGSSVK